jgi:hypothetical protein
MKWYTLMEAFIYTMQYYISGTVNKSIALLYIPSPQQDTQRSDPGLHPCYQTHYTIPQL